MTHEVREIAISDREWIEDVLCGSWGSTRIVTRGVVHHADQLPGFVALTNGKRSGLLTYSVSKNLLEIITLEAKREREGIGSALVNAAIERAEILRCSKIRVVTTNDNTPALQFYKALGFKIVAVRKGAINESRKLKPEIPLIGVNGVQITDEIELERRVHDNTYL
ncbi:MAG: GNAT family N-acetyltransferase [Candidatus Thorarchaeota archaeon]